MLWSLLGKTRKSACGLEFGKRKLEKIGPDDADEPELSPAVVRRGAAAAFSFLRGHERDYGEKEKKFLCLESRMAFWICGLS